MKSRLKQTAAYNYELRLLLESEARERSNQHYKGLQMNEKRSTTHETAQPDLFDPGVGARQASPAFPPGGGGYQKTCTAPKFSARPSDVKKNRDPRLEELHKIGLKRVWLDVADEIGVDAFLAMWRILDADETSRHKEGFLQIHLKLYKSFLRYQRNRYIEALAAQGCKPIEIQQSLSRQLREPVSLRHISRLAYSNLGL